MRNAVAIAQARGCRSLALPLVGAGTGGFEATAVIGLLQDELRGLELDGEVRIVRHRRS